MRQEFAASYQARLMSGLAAANRAPGLGSPRPRARGQRSRLRPAQLWLTNQRLLFSVRKLRFWRFETPVMKRKRIAALLLLILSSAILEAHAQGNGKSLAEKLGFPRDAKLLIVHADDVG